MRILKTEPKNREFFNEHGVSLAKYNLIGLMGQLLSGLSLAYAVFALIIAQTSGKTIPILAIVIALLLGLFVELSNRVLARPAIKPYVVKNKFEDSPESARRHKILNRAYVVGLIAVGLLSFVLSAVGSNYYAEDRQEGPQLINEDSLKQVHAQQIIKVNEQFAADTAMTAMPYVVRLASAEDRFQADSAALMKERRKYQVCANKGNKWCKGKLNEYLAMIDRQRATLADSVAIITGQKAKAMEALLSDRKSEVDQVSTSGTAELVRVQGLNQEARDEHDSETSFQGLIFIILTIAGQSLFYYMVYLTLQVEAGSEIEYTLEPNEFWNLPTVVADFRTGVSWRVERLMRSGLRKLYTPKKQRKTDIPYRSLFNTPENATQETINKTATHGAKTQKSCTSASRARTQSVEAINGLRGDAQQALRSKGEVGAIEECENCGEDYIRKTTRQRFCKDDCRLDFHAKKNNGKRFDSHVLNGQTKK